MKRKGTAKRIALCSVVGERREREWESEVA